MKKGPTEIRRLVDERIRLQACHVLETTCSRWDGGTHPLPGRAAEESWPDQYSCVELEAGEVPASTTI